jgi:hypothetical protein
MSSLVKQNLGNSKAKYIHMHGFYMFILPHFEDVFHHEICMCNSLGINDTPK